MGWSDRILVNFTLRGIATGKKLRDRLLCVHSRIQKMQGERESDRRGIITTPNSPNRMLGSIKKEGKSLFSQMSFNELIN